MKNQARFPGRGAQERTSATATQSNPNPLTVPASPCRETVDNIHNFFAALPGGVNHHLGGAEGLSAGLADDPLGDRSGSAPSHSGEPAPPALGFRQRSKPPQNAPEGAST